MATILAFRTPIGGVSFPDNSSQALGSVDVFPYRQIRVVAEEAAGSAGNVTIRLTITEGEELVAQLDTLTLSPHSQVTNVYAVPGTTLAVFADGSGISSGQDRVGVLIYGN